MKKQNNKNYLTRFILCFLCALLLIPSFAVIAAEREKIPDGYREVHIKSVNDFIKFTEDCTFDRSSENKYFVLDADLDFSGKEFPTVPLFAGIFNGNGHKITGLNYESGGSTTGLFRKVMKGAVVKNLNVSGKIIPAGTADITGGICAVNEGIIEDCLFKGEVVGSSSVGAVSGKNLASGVIRRCDAGGIVNGYNRTGGICGENFGTVEDCKNYAFINNDYRTEIGNQHLSDFDSLLGVTDAGGIAGINEGRIQNCRNEGKVGYPEVGYRIGGIAGTQKGSIVNCINTADILGRRAVGGICGKLICDTKLSDNRDRADELKNQTEKLKDSIITLLTNLSEVQKETGENLDETIDCIEEAQKAVNTLYTRLEAWLNGNIDTVNELIKYFETAIKGMTDAVKDFEELSEHLSKMFEYLGNATEELKKAGETIYPGLDDISDFIGATADFASEADLAIGQIKLGIEHFRAAAGDPEKVNQAIRDISEGFEKLSEALKSAVKRAEELKPVAPGPNDNNIFNAVKQIFEMLKDMSGFLNGFADDFAQIGDALIQISGGINVALNEFNIEEVKNGFDALNQALVHAGNMPAKFEKAMRSLQSALEYIKAAGPFADKAAKELEKALFEMSEASASVEKISKSFEACLNELNKIPPIRFKPVGSDITNACASLSNIISKVNEALKELSGTILSYDVCADLKTVTEELFSTLAEVKNSVDNFGIFGREEPLFRDVSASENDHEDRDKGNIIFCENTGKIKGDTYIGGIAGCAEIENKPTADDLPKLFDLLTGNFEFRVYAAIVSCQSHADIIANKSHAGGIAGYTEYGLIDNCKVTGRTEAKKSHAGGIVGESKSTVRFCKARVTANGQAYVGGICGSGNDVYKCLVLPYFEKYTEHTGSVVGDATGDVISNYYTGSKIGGNNGFSYKGQTELVDYKTLTEKDPDSVLFKEVTVTFILDDGRRVRKSYLYGSNLDNMPDVPDKDNMHWRWDGNAEPLSHDITVNGRYVNTLTALSSDEEKPLIVAEADFADNAKLSLNKFECSNLPEKLKDKVAVGSETVSVSGGPENLKIHFLAKDGGLLYIFEDGNDPREAKYEKDGTYIVFELKNGASFIYTQPVKSYALMITLIISGAAVLALIVFLTVRHIKKKKKKKNISSVENSVEKEI